MTLVLCPPPLQLCRARERLQQLNAELAALQQQAGRMAAKLQSLESDQQRLEQSNDDLLGRQRTEQATIEKLRDDVEASEEEVVFLRQELQDEARARQEEVARLQQQVVELRGELAVRSEAAPAPAGGPSA